MKKNKQSTNDEKERKKQWTMMKNSGNDKETWWKIDEKTMSNDEQKRKNKKNDEKAWKRQWNMMKKRGKKQGSMMKNRVTTMKNDEA